MSFSSRVKEELIPQPLEKPCCVLAETAALTQATGTLGFLGAGRLSVTWRMENAALARRVFRLLREGIGLKPQLHFVEHARLGGRRTCVLTVEGEDAENLLVALRMAEREPDGQVRSDRIYNVRAIPSLYLLGEGQRILMKDAPVERVVSWLQNSQNQ